MAPAQKQLQVVPYRGCSFRVPMRSCSIHRPTSADDPGVTLKQCTSLPEGKSSELGYGLISFTSQILLLDVDVAPLSCRISWRRSPILDEPHQARPRALDSVRLGS
eukprot:5467675-Amphidinium_carterae.2